MSDYVGKLCEEWSGDGHSHHYYYLDELIENRRCFLQKVKHGNESYRIGEDFLTTIDMLEDVAKTYELDHQDVRLIMWFDN